MKSRKLSVLLTMILAMSMFVALPLDALACTGVYIGKDVSTDGTYIIARSNDTQGVNPNHLVIVPARTTTTARQMAVGSIRGLRIPITETTYKYTGTPLLTSMVASGKFNNYDYAACTNDQGVAMSATVTAFANEEAIAADPYVEEGLNENALDQLIISQSASAYDGIKLVASIIDEYGMSSSETLIIADANEAWYMELYTGHQYAAVKLPDDKIATYGNEFSLQFLSEYEDSITSKDIESLPKSKGFAVYNSHGELNLLETYSGQKTFLDYSHRRTWIGHELLAKKKYGDYDINQAYSFTYEPKSKVSVNDVMHLMRNRFDGTEFSPDTTDRLDARVIGSETSMSVHILQVYPQYPKELSCVTWECTGPAVCGVFVPLSNACTSVSQAYGKDQSFSQLDDFDTENYPYYASKECTTLGVLQYDVYAKPVQAYWEDAEKNMTSAFARVLTDAAADYELNPSKAASLITDYCNNAQEMAFADQKEILKALRLKVNADSNSMQLGRNPETHELLTEKRKLDPLVINLDASKYE